ncbi:ATP-binding domain-containing protein [Pseudoalteromonas sp. SR41-8]|uniref:ATP-binding domain-containing protein n=1 Tax=Pseudoalteromonas sp. SR41-8 TaxID=2760946 RepID=UPI0038F80FC2
MTIHAAKGLECLVGYVIDPRFWNSKLDTKDDHLRLMYVALTRASDKLIICKSLSGKIIYSDAPTRDYLLDELCNQEGLFKVVSDS